MYYEIDDRKFKFGWMYGWVAHFLKNKSTQNPFYNIRLVI